MLVIRPMCKGDDCINYENPDANEIKNSVYQIGSKCYSFIPEAVQVKAVKNKE